MPKFSGISSTSFASKKIRRWDVIQNVMDGVPIRICSYNVLCQQNALKSPKLYAHLIKSKRANELMWENRWELLKREFSMIDADIFCLQEVQFDHYDQFFEPFFKTEGYLGKYKKRTREMVDGCAVFYKNYIQLLHYHYIEYYFGVNSVLDRDNVGQLFRLKDMRTQRDLCIFNTHLLFNKWRGDVKLAQVAISLANIDKECGPESGKECPYILCGDFNIEPHSPLYNFIMKGGISFANLRQGDVSGQGSTGGPFVSVNLLPEDIKIARNCRFKDLHSRTMKFPPENCWSHPLNFDSVYQQADKGMKQTVSTYHSVEWANPDFIFYSVGSKSLKHASANGLKLIRRLSLPHINQLVGTLGPWPNSVTPSDHIPLIADFIL
ncbi:unnamed protein product [Thelazia callipaeda]|uniref:Endo/exonuclease/phosphatase domain-containing protein n=1 Tax=Thelazia callipaeda TaxID=103827 RepID=A0A0N5CQG2_THECL|nr:unnamed protein product [Thelazia callipaeda]